ncbi:Uncharacterised protein [Vibrio alginolyticus]|nr:Uncharacterised protein [Vibrio alginolyticus]
MLRKIFRELLISLILGSIPCFIAYHFSGVSGVTNYLKAIDVSETTVYYFLLLSGFQFLISVLGKWAPRRFDSVRKSFCFLYEVANEVGTSLLCLYRIVTGSALGCCLIALTSYPDFGEFKYAMSFFVAALLFLWVCVLISDTYNHARKQQLA